MTELLWTRAEVKRAVRELFGLVWGNTGPAKFTTEGVAAALLASAECERDCDTYDADSCEVCHGTGLNQAAIARGITALRGEKA